jgi:hypothetical protein
MTGFAKNRWEEIGNLENARFPHWKPEISKP